MSIDFNINQQLADAIGRQDSKAVQAILETKTADFVYTVPVHGPNNPKINIIQYAFEIGNIDIIDMLLKDKSFQKAMKDPYFRDAVIISAIFLKNKTIIKDIVIMLINSGVDISNFISLFRTREFRDPSLTIIRLGTDVLKTRVRKELPDDLKEIVNQMQLIYFALNMRVSRYHSSDNKTIFDNETLKKYLNDAVVTLNNANVNINFFLHGETPLDRAFRINNLFAIQFLVEHGARFDTEDHLGQHLLLRHAEDFLADPKRIELLIEQKLLTEEDLQYLINKPDRNGDRLIDHAIRKGNIELLIMLINHGADLSLRNGTKETPLTETFRSVFDDKIRDEMLKILIDKGANPTSKNDFEQSGLSFASESSDELFQMFLNKIPQNERFDAVCNSPTTLYNLVRDPSNLSKLQMLFTNFTDKQKIDLITHDFTYTPKKNHSLSFTMLSAAAATHFDTFKFLADLLPPNERIARLSMQVFLGRSPLQAAFENDEKGSIEYVTSLLEPYKPNERIEALFPRFPEGAACVFHNAIHNCMSEQSFHENQARINYILNNLNLSPEQKALLIKEADNIDHVGYDRRTMPSILERAILLGKIEIIKLLIANGADVTRLSFYGKTPLHVFAEYCLGRDSKISRELRREIVDVLIKAGASLEHKNRKGNSALTEIFLKDVALGKSLMKNYKPEARIKVLFPNFPKDALDTFNNSAQIYVTSSDKNEAKEALDRMLYIIDNIPKEHQEVFLTNIFFNLGNSFRYHLSFGLQESWRSQYEFIIQIYVRLFNQLLRHVHLQPGRRDYRDNDPVYPFPNNLIKQFPEIVYHFPNFLIEHFPDIKVYIEANRVNDFKSRADAISTQEFMRLKDNDESAMDPVIARGVVNHYTDVILPAFNSTYEHFGKTDDDRNEKIFALMRDSVLMNTIVNSLITFENMKEGPKQNMNEVTSRSTKLLNSLLHESDLTKRKLMLTEVTNTILNELKDRKDVTENNFAEVKALIEKITYIRDHFEALCNADKKVMDEARHFFTSNEDTNDMAFRSLDRDAPTDPVWPNLLMNPSVLEYGDANLYSQPIFTGGKTLNFKEGVADVQKRACIYFLCALDPRFPENRAERVQKYIDEMGELRRANNQGSKTGLDKCSCHPGWVTRPDETTRLHPTLFLPDTKSIKELVAVPINTIIQDKFRAMLRTLDAEEQKELYRALTVFHHENFTPYEVVKDKYLTQKGILFRNKFVEELFTDRKNIIEKVNLYLREILKNQKFSLTDEELSYIDYLDYYMVNLGGPGILNALRNILQKHSEAILSAGAPNQVVKNPFSISSKSELIELGLTDETIQNNIIQSEKDRYYCFETVFKALSEELAKRIKAQPKQEQKTKVEATPALCAKLTETLLEAFFGTVPDNKTLDRVVEAMQKVAGEEVLGEINYPYLMHLLDNAASKKHFAKAFEEGLQKANPSLEKETKKETKVEKPAKPVTFTQPAPSSSPSALSSTSGASVSVQDRIRNIERRESENKAKESKTKEKKHNPPPGRKG